MKTYPFAMVRGQTKSFSFTAKYPIGDPNGLGGQPIDLTGATAVSSIRTDSKATPIITLDNGSNGGMALLAQTGATKGQFTWTLQPTQTKSLPVGTYVWDVWVVLSTGEKLPIVWPSDMTLVQESTSF